MDATEIERLKLKLDTTEKMLRVWLEVVYFLYLGHDPQGNMTEDEMIKALETKSRAQIG